TSPDDFHGMAVSQGIITARGGATSHAAVVARQIGKPCVAGSSDLLVDYKAKGAQCAVTGQTFREGDWVSLDGSSGALYQGALPTVEARFEDQPELQRVLGWADEIRRMGVWTNADKPEEAAQARSYGAQGIGLCRTEHMFREGERLEIVRGAILVANQATRAQAKRDAGTTLTADQTVAGGRAGGARRVRRREAKGGPPPGGRLGGLLPGEGRPAGRAPPHRPAAARIPAEPRGAARQGHQGRGCRWRVRRGQGAAR